MVDLSRALVILAVVAVVYLAAAGIVGIGLARWFRSAAKVTRRRTVHWLRWAFLLVALGGIACFLYALLIEPYSLEVTRVRIGTDKLRAGARPARLVLLSDLHCDPEARLEPELPERIAALKPDVILFAGDALNDRAGLPIFRRCMRALVRVAPVYAVRGNWEVWWFSEVELFAGTGVEVLDGEVATLVVGGGELALCGFPVLRGPQAFDKQRYERHVEALLSQAPAGSVRVLLHHFPEVAALGAAHGADLMLAGDTHGGQVRLPFLGALVRISRLGGYWEVGLHDLGKAHLYVTRGVGMEGGAAPRVRFNCKPEVTLIELAPSS